MSTDVSMMPRGGRPWSAIRSGILGAHAVEILAELRVVDTRSLAKNGDSRVGLHEAMPSKRAELPDRHSVSGHNEGLTLIETTHDFTALVAQLSLTNLSHST